MSRRRLEMKIDPEEDKLMLPSSSEDEDDTDEGEQSDSVLSDEEEPEIKDPFEKDESDFDSDSDGAPEALSFRDAFEDSKAQKKQVTQVIKTHLEERKKKRKELHDDFLLKKEEKRQKIESKMLPEEFLDNLEDGPVKEKSLDENVEASESDEENDITMPVSPEAQIAPSEEVVAIHGPTVFKCKVLKEGKKKPKQIPEKVLNFKEQLLYGGRIRRETSARGAMLKIEKQMARRK